MTETQNVDYTMRHDRRPAHEIAASYGADVLRMVAAYAIPDDAIRLHARIAARAALTVRCGVTCEDCGAEARVLDPTCRAWACPTCRRIQAV